MRSWSLISEDAPIHGDSKKKLKKNVFALKTDRSLRDGFQRERKKTLSSICTCVVRMLPLHKAVLK